MRRLAILLSVAGLAATAAFAQSKPSVDPAKADAAMKAAFPKAPADWQSRLAGDQTMRECSENRNAPPAALAKAIQAREKATIQYPTDGNLVGDWKKGNALAQSGYGLRFTDYPAKSANGGNCFACHQLTKAEISFGTVGPTLLEYGKIRKFSEADTKAAYEKIYNGHVAFPCSLMPRFGTNGVLTIDQIKDLTALLMSPDSPVNK
jgi:sulfur-oxidizing protein SoxX